MRPSRSAAMAAAPPAEEPVVFGGRDDVEALLNEKMKGKDILDYKGKIEQTMEGMKCLLEASEKQHSEIVTELKKDVEQLQRQNASLQETLQHVCKDRAAEIDTLWTRIERHKQMMREWLTIVDDATMKCIVLEETVSSQSETIKTLEAKLAVNEKLKEFGDQGEGSVVLSPRLKEISTPDRPVALRFLGEKYNNPMERYKKQVCSEECEGSDVEQVAGVGEALRIFMEEFGDQGEDSIVLSPRLKEISTPDRPAALHFLGEKYNNLMERYKKQVLKCSEECDPRYNGLKKKYTDESAERRRLYNELIELRGNIRVFCRCRPLSSDEVTRGCLSVVEIDPSQESELQFVPNEKERKPFKFDHVFGPEEDQEAVFLETAPVVRSVMDGFNVCIFAYGQTGTGKTFTMEGVPENRGVNYRALEELFRMSEERSESIAYTFSVSILEVYNEKIRDLLDEGNDQSRRLDIKQNAAGAQEVQGLIEAPIYNIDGVWEKLKFGAQNRSVGSTNANELSSRSHSLVRVTVRSENLVTFQRSRSHLWLVDLAGSERLAKTGVEGDRLKESQFIKKSLSALGDVISALTSKNSHIPYRNSKLTHLLQSSLGGDCKTLMFVQISPSSMDSGETLSSLNFASRVRSVEHGPARKQADPAESLKLKQMTEKLRHEEKENAQLNQSLQLMQHKYASRENVFRTLNEKVKNAEQACRNYQQRIRELENELGNEKRASRDSGRSSRPPLVPARQRQPQEAYKNLQQELGMREDPAFGFVDNTGAGGWDGATAAAALGGGAPDMYAFRVVPSQPNLHGMAYGSHDLRLG